MDDDQRRCKKLQPKVGIGMKQSFRDELRKDKNYGCGQCGLCREHGEWIGRYCPVTDLKYRVADQGAGLQSAKHQGEVVSNQHGGDEELRSVCEMRQNLALPGARSIQFYLQTIGGDISNLHSGEKCGSKEREDNNNQRNGGVRVHGRVLLQV